MLDGLQCVCLSVCRVSYGPSVRMGFLELDTWRDACAFSIRLYVIMGEDGIAYSTYGT